MRKLFTHIAFFLCLVASAQTVEITDAGLKTCLVEKYDFVLDDNQFLDTVKAADYTGWIGCKGYDVEDMGLLGHFSRITSLTFSENPLSSESVLAMLDSIETIHLVSCGLSSLPDLSGLTKLQFLDVQRNGLPEFPSLPAQMQTINVGHNPIPEFPPLSDFPVLEEFHGYNTRVTEVTGYENLRTLRVFNVPGNEGITELASFENLDSLERINVGSCELTSIEGLDNKPHLEFVGLIYNHFTSLPPIDLSNDPEINVAGNALSTEDLIPFASWDKFTENMPNYGIQETLDLDSIVTLALGSNWAWELDLEEEVSSSYYLWFRNAEQIDSTSDALLEVSQVVPMDSGAYRVEIHHPELSDLVVKIKGLQVGVMSDFDAKEPFAFSPNGDGQADYFFIEEAGQASVFSNSGQLIRELNTPVYWDGTDASGRLLDFGYYFIVVNGDSKIGVTLAR